MNAWVKSKTALVGIDGFSPLLMKRYLARGDLPAIRSLIENGVEVPLISTLPATTPVAWATIVTGAPPSRTGIEGFLVHVPGDRLDQRISGCYSHRCHAEPIWETVSMEGKRSYVIKFPISYPSSTATFRLDGAAGWGGLKCFHEAASASVGSTDSARAISKIEPHAKHWGSEDRREALIHWRGRWHLPSLWGKEDIVLHLILAEVEDGTCVLEIASRPDRDQLLAVLKEGEWSPPLTIQAQGRKGKSEFCFRVKALCLSNSPLHIDVANTTLHERMGHSTPESLWRKYLESAGPIEEQTEPSLVFHSVLDIETQLEIFEFNTEWLKKISTQILTREQWDLFMVHIHVVDWAHHLLQGSVDPRHPEYDPQTAPRYEQAMLRCYQMADSLVAVVADAIGSDANLIVLGDHGQDIQHSIFRVNEWLAAEGYLFWENEGMAIDWGRTKVCALGNYIYINQLGREPSGIVAPSETDQLKTVLIEKLLGITDPSTGSRPILIVGDKYEFELLGANGQGVGDLVFCLCSGYQAANNRGEVFSKTKNLAEFTSGHDHFWPLDPRIHTRFFARGPSFRSGYVHPRTARLEDVAPTLCAVLGVSPSDDCEGKILQDLLSVEKSQSKRRND